MFNSCSYVATLQRLSGKAELDAVLQHHHNLQEKLAEDMLNLARNLKNNTLAAQNIIKQDNQVAMQAPRVLLT
ncbi:SNAP receptor use1 [Goodea atripinnis]|uniref:Vesicle transport protein USE1 n=1 Tax=Goodea atripinnis TaxID=208336 RepID=A0ABV0N1P7_9TELE